MKDPYDSKTRELMFSHPTKDLDAIYADLFMLFYFNNHNRALLSSLSWESGEEGFWDWFMNRLCEPEEHDISDNRYLAPYLDEIKKFMSFGG